MSLVDFIQAMPKVELHVHLEGTVQPETLLELAGRYDVELPASDIAGLRDWYRFRDFDHFISIFSAICGCLRAPDDFVRIVYEYGRSMHAQNIRYAEVTFSPYTHVTPQLPWDALLAAVNQGRAQAEQEWGVRMRWIPDIVRCFPDTASTVVDWLTTPQALAGGVVALGLGGPEVGWPPELFEDAFRVALSRGLHSNPHAGETVGPASIWGALRAIKAERLGHGVRAGEDTALLDYVVKHQIPLEVSLTSNLCLGVAPTYAAHPLAALVRAGVCVTLNTDDPAMFNTTLQAEYVHAVQDCGLTIEQLKTIGLNAVRASYLPDVEKTAMISDFQAAYDDLSCRFTL